MKGIDVSEHNGIIKWELAKSSIDFAILRIGWIGNHENHTIDKQFERNLKECKRNNIPVGIYVYCYSNNEQSAKSGAEWVLKQLRKYNASLELPVYIDMEDSTIRSLGKTKLTNIVKAFNTIIENNGLWAGVYANLDWYTNYLNKDEIKKKYTTWIAHYGVSEDKYKSQYDMLQYTSTGAVNGVGANVDKNNMYRDLIKDISKSGTNSSSNGTISSSNGTISSKYYPKCNSQYNSIVDGLNSINIKSDYNTRKKIAIKNGISNYTGTASQNLKLLSLLKNGKLQSI